MCRDCWKTQPRNRPSFEDLGNTMRSVPKAPRAVSADGKDSGLPPTPPPQVPPAPAVKPAGDWEDERRGDKRIACICISITTTYSQPDYSTLHLLLQRPERSVGQKQHPEKEDALQKPRGASTAATNRRCSRARFPTRAPRRSSVRRYPSCNAFQARRLTEESSRGATSRSPQLARAASPWLRAASRASRRDS